MGSGTGLIQLLFVDSLHELRFQFGIKPCGAGGQGKKINGMGGFAETLEAIRTFAREMLFDVEAGAFRDGAQQIQLVVFV